MTERLDCVVIGAGVVGLAVGRALALAGREVVVLEKSGVIGQETSSRNSEVIHAGIYYPTGSLKARLCVRGKAALYQYCEERGIPHTRIGKIIVATSEDQIATLEAYRRRAKLNGVDDLTMLDRYELAELEPQLAGVRGLLSPSTGIIDSHAFMLALQGDLERAGGTVVLKSPVMDGRITTDGIVLRVGGADPSTVVCRTVVNSAGLWAPMVAASLSGIRPSTIPTPHFAKGCYFSYAGHSPFSRLVYPVAETGGLGVHVTLDMAGRVRFGPNVVWQNDIDYSFPPGLRDAFADSIVRYFPRLDRSRLLEGYTGIRPKLVPQGAPSADFEIQGPETHGVPGLVNLYGIESPGLTSALAIGDHVRRMNG
jgi:L-2-hydroxyglutarate oxidase LhgO